MLEKMFLRILSPCFFIAALTGAVNMALSQNCIEPSVASVSGLLPGIDKDALKNIDKYYSVETVKAEDDSCDYEALIFNYAQYKITIVHDMVGSIRNTSPGYLWEKRYKNWFG